MSQLAIPWSTHGGARRGAGRKPEGRVAGVSHDRRPELNPRHPVLVTLRVRVGVPNLRTERAMGALRKAFAEGCRQGGFRLVHFAVMGNHVHYVVEADGKRSLVRGMQGLSVRCARAVNRLAGRRGSVWADRYHASSLGTPRQVRNALAYVLLNRQRHGDGRRVQFVGGPIDPCTSGAAFDGWAGDAASSARAGPDATSLETTAEARTWLLTTGWRRHGAIDVRETPGPSR